MIKESWTSDKGNREDHYFVKNDTVQYYFGYNPELINGEKLQKILEILDIN